MTNKKYEYSEYEKLAGKKLPKSICCGADMAGGIQCLCCGAKGTPKKCPSYGCKGTLEPCEKDGKIVQGCDECQYYED